MTSFTKPLTRRGFDALLLAHPHLDVVDVDWMRVPAGNAPNPWILVELGQPSEPPADAVTPVDAFAIWKFAIWKNTGSVYTIEPGGAVADDPILTVA